MRLASRLVVVAAVIGCSSSPTRQNLPTPTPTPPPVPDVNALIARCPTPAEVAAIDADLTITFEDDPTAGQVVCTAAQSSRDLTLLQAQVYRVLVVARQLTFDQPLPWTSSQLYAWLVSSIRGIRVRGDIQSSFCCSPRDIIDIHANGIAALQFPSDFRWVGPLLVLFVHEARHNNGYPHSCGNDDQTIAELGAWGVQYYFNLFLATHSDPAFIPTAMRGDFLRDATGVCSARFCQDHCP